MPDLTFKFPRKAVLDSFNVMVFPFPGSMMMPPVPENVVGNSKLMVLVDPVPLYWMVEAAPKVGGTLRVADPSIDRMPLTVGIAVSDLTPDPEKDKLLKMVEDPLMDWSPALPKLMVPVPALKVPVRLQATPGKLALSVLEPPFNVPAVIVIAPVKVWLRLVPRFRFPPAPFIVRPAPLIFPVNVVLPAVRE